jgi:hypothetical protein
MIWGTDDTGAMSIYAVTTTSPTSSPTPDPTPQPTTTPSGNNLEPLSAFMNSNDVPNMPGGGNFASYDTSVTYNGYPSIQDTSGGSPSCNGEVDGAWISVKPGDLMIMSIWVKTSTFSSNDMDQGSFFGFDFYGNTNLGFGILGNSPTNQAGHPTAAEQGMDGDTFGYTVNGANGMTDVSGLICRVPFGKGWTEIQWDFIVPSQTWNYIWQGNGVNQCNPTQIDALVPWLGVNNNGQTSAPIWYSDPVLYDLGQTSLP